MDHDCVAEQAGLYAEDIGSVHVGSGFAAVEHQVLDFIAKHDPMSRSCTGQPNSKEESIMLGQIQDTDGSPTAYDQPVEVCIA